MIRNLKVLLAAAIALTAFGALNATGAQAAEEFHCALTQCRLTLNPDGEVGSATAHQVFVVTDEKGATLSLTCKQLTGDARVESATKAVPEVTVTGLAYDGCNVVGEPFAVRMNECDYDFKAINGGTVNGAEVHIRCPGSKHIELEITSTKCLLEVTPQTLVGIHYHNIPVGEKKEVTVETSVPNVSVEWIFGTKANCLGLEVGAGKKLTAKFSTGNTIVTGEEDVESGGTMVNVWWE